MLEYEAFEPGDEVILVDNIEDIAGHDWETLNADIFKKNEVYTVREQVNEGNKAWVSIEFASNGDTSHGWPRERWQFANTEQIDIYELFKMEKGQDNE